MKKKERHYPRKAYFSAMLTAYASPGNRFYKMFIFGNCSKSKPTSLNQLLMHRIEVSTSFNVWKWSISITFVYIFVIYCQHSSLECILLWINWLCHHYFHLKNLNDSKCIEILLWCFPYKNFQKFAFHENFDYRSPFTGACTT